MEKLNISSSKRIFSVKKADSAYETNAESALYVVCVIRKMDYREPSPFGPPVGLKLPSGHK